MSHDFDVINKVADSIKYLLVQTQNSETKKRLSIHFYIKNNFNIVQILL